MALKGTQEGTDHFGGSMKNGHTHLAIRGICDTPPKALPLATDQGTKLHVRAKRRLAGLVVPKSWSGMSIRIAGDCVD